MFILNSILRKKINEMKTGNAQFNYQNYQELIDNARKMRQNEYTRLSPLSYEKLLNVTNQSLASITLTRPTSDIALICKISSLIYTLIKLRQDHFPKLIAILNFLKTSKNEQVGIFVSFVYSKVLKHAQREFLQQKLDVCLLKLQSASNVLQTAYFLYFLAKHSPNSILLCITQFINAATKVVMHKREDVRFVGYRTLKIYLQILNRNRSGNSQNQTFPLYIFAQKNLGKSHYERHGAFLIFAALLEYSPESINYQAFELLIFFFNILPKSPIDIKSLALLNLVFLSHLEKDSFQANWFDTVAECLIHENQQTTANNIFALSLYNLFHFLPESFSKFSYSFLAILRNLLIIVNNAPLNEGFSIFSEVVQHFPNVIKKNFEEIANILCATKICQNFNDIFPNFFHQFPTVWHLFKGDFITKVLSNPELLNTIDILNFIATCPLLDSEDILPYLIKSLSNKDPEVRCSATRALLAQIRYDDDHFLFETIYRLVTIALSDPEPKVREMILRSFNSKCYRFLTTEPILTCITTLLKDEKITVSIAAIELLGEISKLNPFDTLPLLRSLLLDGLLLVDSPGTLRAKEEMTRSFLTIINAAEEILPVYCPTFCLISLRQLSFTPLCELTYFDQTYLDNINLNITKAIGIIAERDVSLIITHIPQFTSFFIWLLQQHGPKQLKIAIVTTLYKMLSSQNTIGIIDVAPVFTALTTIASKWNSRKLNLAVLKLIGLIGAIDQSTNNSDNSSKLRSSIKPSNPSYGMSLACKTLISVLSDDFLVVHHSEAIRSLVNIFCYDKTATVSYFNEFMLIFLDQIRKQKSPEYVVLLNKLCGEAPKEWIMHYNSELLDLVKELMKTSLLSVIIDLIPTLAYVFADCFASFLPECITFLLNCIFVNRTMQYDICHKSIVALVSMKSISKDYLFLIYPEIMNVITMPTALLDIRLDAITAMRILIQTTSCISYSASLIRCIIECLQSNESQIQLHSMMLLYSLMVKLGDLFSFYAEQVVLTLQKQNLLTGHFLEILKSKSTSYSDFPFIDITDPLTIVFNQSDESSQERHVHFSEEEIHSALIFQEEATPWHWKGWYKRIVKTLLDNSLSISLNSCSFLSEVLFNLAETLLNPAFFSIWMHLSSHTQLLISASLTTSLMSDALPNAVRTLLINLIDFMERSEQRIPISWQILYQASKKCSQFAKAYYFAQKWYEEDPLNIQAIETLIQLATCLGLKKTIIGISTHLKNDFDITSNPQWSEQLGQWAVALESNRSLPLTSFTLEGIMRCLKHLQRWDEIIEMIPDLEPLLLFNPRKKINMDPDEIDDFPYPIPPEHLILTPSQKKRIASILAIALFHRQQWTKMPLVLDHTNQESVRILIITALYQVSQNKREEALQTVARGFNVLAKNAYNVFKHDKVDWYPLLVKAQELQEISEIAQNTPSIDIWAKRLSLCRKSYNVYHQLLSVRLTVFTINEPIILKESLKMLKFALNTQDFQLFDASLNFLFPNKDAWPIEVSFIHAKGMWARGEQRSALGEAKDILKRYKTDNKHLKAKIFFSCGQWIISMTPPSQVSSVITNAIKFLEQSIMQGTHYYRAWHRWAWASSVIYNADKTDLKSAFNAINGFLECVRLKNEASLSELLQMISLFFTANLNDELFVAVASHIANLSDKVLLMIIPQLFTQLINPKTRISAFASQIAWKLLPNHFHVLLYPLIFLARHEDTDEEDDKIPLSLSKQNDNEEEDEIDMVSSLSSFSKPDPATHILKRFEAENPAAVHQSRIVSDGLLLCSSSPFEIYSDVIVKTVRLLQKHKIIMALRNLNQFIRKDTSSLKTRANDETQQVSEGISASISLILSSSPLTTVNQVVDIKKELVYLYSKLESLVQTVTSGKKYNNSVVQVTLNNLIKDFHELYGNVHSTILASRTVSMHSVAPTLAQLKNSILAVPGTYSIDEPIINIFQFDPTLDIFNSKQRPRLLSVFGSDGISHKSLLKGREDLRMDQRVMQFFKLINQHIQNDFMNDSRSTRITTFSITPLSTCAGLIQFVDGTDTIYSLISDYRTNHKVRVFSELESMEKETISDIDNLRPIQRLEALRNASSEYKDTDLRELMWLNSISSREWVNRTLQFTQSSALMSIIGYVIGLGDRHPSNLMIQRKTGCVVHIDFGECFEVGKKRIKFPEKVPFRLTRMMTRAFGPTGIDGEFRITCEETVKLVRSHKESIMAVLDIFLQEPIENITESDDFEASSTAISEERINKNKSNNTQNLAIPTIDISGEFDEEEDRDLTKLGSIEDSLNRIMQKITGNDFDIRVKLTIEQQVEALIQNATDMYNMAYLYHGWTPLW